VAGGGNAGLNIDLVYLALRQVMGQSLEFAHNRWRDAGQRFTHRQVVSIAVRYFAARMAASEPSYALDEWALSAYEEFFARAYAQMLASPGRSQGRPSRLPGRHVDADSLYMFLAAVEILYQNLVRRRAVGMSNADALASICPLWPFC
jgi:hypothetical protein